MNGARAIVGVASMATMGFMACNYTDGECFPREELYEPGGVGGGVIVSSGAGGYGSVPLEPQGVPPEPDEPVCNIISGGPCDDECQAQYDTDSSACARIEDAAKRRTCQDEAHVNYRDCQEKCEMEGANRVCIRKYVMCQRYAPYWCRSGAGYTVCAQCHDRCRSGDPPSTECVQCGF